MADRMGGMAPSCFGQGPVAGWCAKANEVNQFISWAIIGFLRNISTHLVRFSSGPEFLQQPYFSCTAPREKNRISRLFSEHLIPQDSRPNFSVSDSRIPFARTEKKTPFATVPLLLHMYGLPRERLPSRCLETNVSEPFRSYCCFSGCTVLAWANTPKDITTRCEVPCLISAQQGQPKKKQKHEKQTKARL
jgi:hypothetical protein